MQIPRLFIGKHRELRRPANIVDEGLMARIDEARQRLQLEGKEVKPVRAVRNDSSTESRGRHDRVVALRAQRSQRAQRAQPDTGMTASRSA